MKKLSIVLLTLALALAFAFPAMAAPVVDEITYGTLQTYNRSAQSTTTNGDVTLVAPISNKRIYLYRITLAVSSDVTGTFTARMAAAGGSTVHATMGRVVNPAAGVQYVLMSAHPHVEISETGSLVEVNIPSGGNTTTLNWVYQQRK
jgi:hypothetical protein